MKLLLLQTDPQWLSPDENRRRAEELIDRSMSTNPEQIDLVVLPEMFATGFAVEPEGAAEGVVGGATDRTTEPAENKTLKWMQKTAARLDAAIAGSVAVKDNEKYYNRLYFVRPDGSFTKYDKRHLFSYSGEDKHYTAGTERTVVEWRGWRILMQVCYDLRFPVFSRNTGDYDMILYPANWPTVRIHPWNTLLRARAIENACYAVGVNRTGTDPYTSYSGGTALIDFKGATLAAASDNQEEAVLCEADIETLRAFRAKFPVLDDADDFILNL
jgi:predicted amidohydrolase